MSVPEDSVTHAAFSLPLVADMIDPLSSSIAQNGVEPLINTNASDFIAGSSEVTTKNRPSSPTLQSSEPSGLAGASKKVSDSLDSIPPKPNAQKRTPMNPQVKGEGKRKRVTTGNSLLDESVESNTTNSNSSIGSNSNNSTNSNNNSNINNSSSISNNLKDEETKDFQMRLPLTSASATDTESIAPSPHHEVDFPEDFTRPPAPAEAMLTSDELNFLVYRYLLESGFVHSAFVFGGESYIAKTNIEDTAQLVPGALISFVQKGLQYLEIESHINDDGTETVCDEAFSVMKPHVCSSNTTKKRIFEPYEPMSADYGFLEIDDDEILLLKGHDDLITTCVWSPNGRFLASGSADGATRIWELQNQSIPGKCSNSLLLKGSTPSSKIDDEADKKSSGSSKAEEPSRKRPRARKVDSNCTRSSVLALAWKDDSILATGSFDGTTQVWSTGGQLLHSSTHHQGPVCCVQWAKKGGSTFASGGMDSAVFVFNEEGTVLAKYSHHTGPILDLDWKNDTMFATGSTDKKVCVFEVGKSDPIREFTNHRADVNAVKWDCDGYFLASCGADCAVKVWNVATGACVHDFREHTREVVCLAWAPSSSSASSSSSSSSTLLASGSMDTTIKIWDLTQGKCCLTIAKHAHPVTALIFSAQGDTLVSGAHERLCQWNVKDGELLRTFKHEGGINYLSWNNDGKLAAGYSDHSICVIDLTSRVDS